MDKPMSYQLAGISQDVEADDSIFEHKSALAVVSFSVTRRFYFGKSARLFEGAMLQHEFIFLYTIDCGNGRKCWSAIFGN
jgi:magnesium transporter